MALRRPLVRILGKLRILPAEDKLPFSTVDELGTAAKLTAQTTVEDYTPGRALSVSGLGFGASYSLTNGVSYSPDAQATDALGFWRYAEPTTAGTPTGAGYGAYLNIPTIRVPATDERYGAQLFFDYAADTLTYRRQFANVWQPPVKLYHTGNIGGASVSYAVTAGELLGNETDWATYRTRSVANMLGWTAFGNGHVVFDASGGLSPSGSAIGNVDPSQAWQAGYPTLMGWNGAGTYGVRVDRARVAEGVGTLYQRVVAVVDGQTGYDTAGLESRSTAGNVVISLHAAGSSAAAIRHARGGNGVDILDSSGAIASVGCAVHDGEHRRVMFPQGGFFSGAPSVVGALAIVIPTGFVNRMMSMTIRVYNYVARTSFEVRCGGYTYETGEWVNAFASIICAQGTADHVIRFGRTAAGLPVIYIGEVYTQWAYPQVFVTDVCSGFASGVAAIGWSVLSTQTFENVTDAVTNAAVGRRPLPQGVGASRALALVDAEGYLRTSTALTITVPANATISFPVGTEITIRAAQASGNTTIAAASGVTLVAPADGTLVLGPRMTVTLKKVDTDTWDVIGQTVPA